MAYLYVIQGSDQGVRKDIAGINFKIGRDSANDLKLRDTEVSRFHAEIRVTEAGLEIHDNQSSNGTFVNGSRCETVILTSGDRIQLGSTHFIVTDTPVGTRVHSDASVLLDGSANNASRILTSARPRTSIEDTEAGGSYLSEYEHVKRHLQVMYETTKAVSQTIDIEQLLEKLLNLIFEWVEADRGCIILLDPNTGEMLPKVSRYREAAPDSDEIVISKRILEYVVQHNEGVLTTDATDDHRWEAAGSILGNQIKEAICVPLSGRYSVVGVIYIDTSRSDDAQITGVYDQHFSEEHLKLMVAIAHQAALAIEDTMYYSSMLQAERLAAIGQTVTAISHHIKNILQGVKGGSYLVDEGLKKGEVDTLKKGWEIVQRNQRKISDLAWDMLSFSKERRPEALAANLNHVVEDVSDLLEFRAGNEGTALVVDGLTGNAEFVFDADAIHRALLNITVNALDAVMDNPNGEVRIAIEHDAGHGTLQIEVADNGPGIPESERDRIFQPFVSDKGSRGTGLGLAVSRKILREHDGDIVIASNTSSGTKFNLMWPAVSPVELAEKLRESSVVDQNKLI